MITPDNACDTFKSALLLTSALSLFLSQSEKDRMDIYHKLFDVARRGQLHQAPISTTASSYDPPRILDLGCGTGIWAIDMAE